MSEAPELTGDEALAAEHALGVLSFEERGVCEARAVSDPIFAAMVDEWRSRLAPVLDSVPEVPAPQAAWPVVERRVARQARRADDRKANGALNFWRAATVGGLLATAASLALTVSIANRPQTVVIQGQPTPAPLMSASLTVPTGEAGGPMFVAAYDPERKQLLVTSLMPPTDADHVHQLWVIPEDGKPRPLGFIAPGASAAMPMAEPMAPMMKAGSTIAVSVEPMGGSKQEGPSGPIAAVGKLARV